MMSLMVWRNVVGMVMDNPDSECDGANYIPAGGVGQWGSENNGILSILEWPARFASIGLAVQG